MTTAPPNNSYKQFFCLSLTPIARGAPESGVVCFVVVASSRRGVGGGSSEDGILDVIVPCWDGE